MSLCNHTVVDYGTFGLWAALLAEGRIILPASKKELYLMSSIQGVYQGGQSPYFSTLS